MEGTTDNQIDAAGNVTSSATIQGKVHGVLATGASTRIENHGAIIGGTGAGVDLGGNSSMLENSGWIIGQTNGLAALKGGSKSVTNSGRIVGKAGNGIQFNGENSSLTNSGTIEGMDVAILVTDSGASNNLSIVNSGLLKTANSNNGSQYFIRDLGSNNITLTLNPGTRFEYGTETEPALALLDLGGGSNTVNIETGLSTVLLLTVGERTDENGNALADSTLPEINAASGIVVTENLSDSGLRVCAGDDCLAAVTVDESAVAIPDTQLVDLTRGISSAISARLSTVRNDIRRANVTGFSSDGENSDWLDHRFWTQGFGSIRQNRGSSSTVGGHQQLGSLMFGADEQISNGILGDIRGGIFGGIAVVGQETSFNTLRQNSQSYFFGGYASLEQDGLTYDISLIAGYSDIEQERRVVEGGGTATAESQYDSWFVSPEIRITKELPIEAHTMYASLGLGYSALLLDGYTESGVADPVTVNSRDVHIGVARGELSLPGTVSLDDGSQLHYRMLAGLEARRILGGERVQGSVFSSVSGNTLLLDHVPASHNTDAYGAFVGLSGEYDFTKRMAANAGVEGMVETTGDYQVSGTVGLRFRF